MSKQNRPNILFITTDQHRGDCLGCAGHPAVETPYLDQLASEGALFTKAYTAVPSCTPARSCILTGMDQWHHGRLTMTGSDALEFPATLPGELAQAGYHTQGVGKMHFFPQRRLYGFHHLVLDESSRQIGRFVSDYRAWFEEQKEGSYGYRDHSVDWNSWMGRPTHLPEHLHPTYWTASEGIKFIKNRDPSKPFFLWLSFARPHSPYEPPQVYWDMYADNPDIPEPVIGDWAEEFGVANADVNAPWGRRSAKEIRRARVGYYGSITFIDHQIGRLLYELRHFAPRELANTLIVFTSDHGDMLGDHYHWRKTYAYEGSAHVPFIVRFPLHWDLPRHQVRDELVELRDVMPTLLDAAGVDIPESVDGQSLLPLLRGETADWREYVQGEHTLSYGLEWGNQWITDGRHKYVWFHHTGRELFFDLEQDPGECRNLIADPAYAERINLLRQRLADINERRGDPRGQGGKLVSQPQGALRLSPYYQEWKRRAEEIDHGAQP
ncbi:MAG: arylsulfatase [Limnochordia bacterium]